MKIELAKTEVIHFIGIGGIGMSGLSLIMKGKGFKVQGSDLSSNKNIDRLKKEEIKVFIAPKIIGGENNMNPVSDLEFLKMDEVISLCDSQISLFGNDICLKSSLNQMN